MRVIGAIAPIVRVAFGHFDAVYAGGAGGIGAVTGDKGAVLAADADWAEVAVAGLVAAVAPHG